MDYFKFLRELDNLQFLFSLTIMKYTFVVLSIIFICSNASILSLPTNYIEDQFQIQKFYETFGITPNNNPATQQSLHASIADASTGNSFNYDDFLKEMKITQVKTQGGFDYQKFLETFDLLQLQASNSNLSFDYDKFQATFGVKNKANAESQFNYQEFLNTFGLQGPEQFDYKKFSETFNIKQQKVFDIQKFYQTFGISIKQRQSFDFVKFCIVFKLKQCQQVNPFDYESFKKAFSIKGKSAN